MSHTMRIALAVLSLLILSACEPMGPMPGKSLSGNLSEPPDSWLELNAEEVIQLEVNGPYSVNLWGVGMDHYFYVAAASGLESRWAKRIAVDPKVRLRVRESVFELTALMVEDAAEKDRVGMAFSEKYDIEASEDFPDVIIYRLETR